MYTYQMRIAASYGRKSSQLETLLRQKRGKILFKKKRLKEIRTYRLLDTSGMFHQMNYQVNWQKVILRVHIQHV